MTENIATFCTSDDKNESTSQTIQLENTKRCC